MVWVRYFLQGKTLLITLFIVFLSYSFAPLLFDRNDGVRDEDQRKCPEGSFNDPRHIQRPNEDIKVIRLTNSGELVRRCDLANVFYELVWGRSHPQSAHWVDYDKDAKVLPNLVVLYVHGWKHSTDLDDTDLLNFSKLITDLRKNHKGEKHVTGVYVGWNASAELPFGLDNLSFWVKKRNADRIAQSAILTRVVASIGAITKRSEGGKDQFIAIGHSFGARILFSATSQSLINEVEKAHPGYPGGTYTLIKGAADAVILLNPAFEASRYTTMDSITRFDENFSRKQPPLVVTIATDNDWATQLAFPLGQLLGLASSPLERNTLGNFDLFITHKLFKSAGNVCGDGIASEIDSFAGRSLCLERMVSGSNRTVVQPYNPFIVARTTSDVIPGHNKIWEPLFSNWLIEFISDLERIQINN